MFAYCCNNPINCSDPSGLFSNQFHAVAFSNEDDLYIYNQNDAPYASMSLGVASVAHGGCGPVAVYNAMQLLGRYDTDFTDVVNFYKDNDYLFLGGLLGSSYTACIRYFEDYGYTVLATTDVHMYADVAVTADACILCYWYDSSSIIKVGAHYIAFKQDGNIGTYYNPFSNSKGPYYFSGDCYDFLTYVDGCLPLLILIYE